MATFTPEQKPVERVPTIGKHPFPFLVQVLSSRHPDIREKSIGMVCYGLEKGYSVWISGIWMLASGTYVAEARSAWYPKNEVARIAWPAYIKEMACIRSVYLAGPMSGLPFFNKPAFWFVEYVLGIGGLKVHSPANHPAGMPYHWYMQKDLEMLLACEGVLFLKGWRESKGANLEHQVAEITKKKIIYEV